MKVTEKINQPEGNNLLKLSHNHICDCIIDSFTPRFAELYAQSELKKINAAPSCLPVLTALFDENQKVWSDCIRNAKH